jgi:hypothetical protein
MKSHFMSGVSARVQRWGYLMNVVLFGGLIVGLSLASAAPKSNVTLVAQCIPMNDQLVGPLRPFVREIIGGVGGFIPIAVSVIIIVLILLGMWKVARNEEMSGIIKGIIAVPGVLLIGIAVLIIVNGVIVVFNGLCASNPF